MSVHFEKDPSKFTKTYIDANNVMEWAEEAPAWAANGAYVLFGNSMRTYAYQIEQQALEQDKIEKKERADFMAWQRNHLPQTDYVRWDGWSPDKD